MTEEDIKYWSIIALEYYVENADIVEGEREQVINALEYLYG
jgi:hypothetical protein